MYGQSRWMLSALLFLVASEASSHKLATKATEEERRLAGIKGSSASYLETKLAQWSVAVFTEPVHEEITNRIYGCDGDICKGSGTISAPAPVLAGVRWNDDPPFRMKKSELPSGCKPETIRFETQPTCWITLFNDAKRGAARGKRYGSGSAMLYRTHFGDLQFLHSMATQDGETAAETKAQVMDWLQFSWRTALGEYRLETRLADVPIPRIRDLFENSDWRLQELFTLGASGGLRQDVHLVAFGSLLHTLEDSYAEGHVNREESSGSVRCRIGDGAVDAPGAIREFHAYNRQDHAAHSKADSRASFLVRYNEPGDVVEVGRAVLHAYRKRLPWDEVQPFFDCIFQLRNPGAPAGPGDFVR